MTLALDRPVPVDSPCHRAGDRDERTIRQTVLVLEGEHDISTVPDLVLMLARSIPNDSTDVVLDVSLVTFIDAAKEPASR